MNDQEYNRLYQEMVDREFIKWLDGQIEHQKKVFDKLKGQGQSHTRNRVDAYINGLQSAKSKYCEIEIEAATPNPWTTITADPATLPPDQEVVLLAVWDDKNFGEGKSWVVPGWRRQVWGVYYAILKTGNTEIVGNVYKWQSWPTPPPYPSADEQEARE